ncbi:hypothetical protein [Ureibacillus aquaedulcis]|uniref:Uncharacterized protein n=1 Tax=Ureibacillus aquaedulcis TaxID=3058421 RepID=A0ABT8GNT8_9BACL|nr:hypothetical protein [Ureibacillus sp. BA0131]MDN4493085.1 hypothetical protein [Ureibacillus sp. BA0131]
MYYPNNIEDICYEESHIEQVTNQIKSQFYDYFDLFIQSEAGTTLSENQVRKLAEKFGSDGIVKARKKDIGIVLKRVIAEGIEKFEKDRNSYTELLDEEALEEYEDNPAGFKSALSKDCPIIRGTLNSPAKELDKYKYEFRISNPNELLTVSQNLATFANSYAEECEGFEYDSIETLEDLGFESLDTEDYSVFGVIGGGIKSQFVFKLQPAYFPYRSKEAIWAFWYLTNKKTFGCEEGSQFLMINVEKSLTNQNYFYPYELFSFYAYQVYLLLKKEAEKNSVYIPEMYRYVLVDQFLSFIAKKHEEDIKFISSSSEDKSYSWI